MSDTQSSCSKQPRACSSSQRLSAQRNIHSGFADDSDEASERILSASSSESHTTLHVSYESCAPPRKKRKSDTFACEVDETESDDEEEMDTSSQAPLRIVRHIPRVYKTEWRLIKEYDRRKMEDAAIDDDIDQIMLDSFRDAKFHAENMLNRDSIQIVDISSKLM